MNERSESYLTFSLKVAEIVKAEILANPTICLGLPTGRSPLGVYQHLSFWSENNQLNWRKVRCFGLDEYLDVEETSSFKHYLEHNLYQHTNLPLASRFNPAYSENYDQLISAVGGLDLIILGIGRNGHIAFNEPGIPLNSWTHSIWLTQSTRAANAEFFGKTSLVPVKAITMGIRTILGSRQIILIANNNDKKEILHKALYGEITPEVPASFLQLHNNLRVITAFDSRLQCD